LAIPERGKVTAALLLRRCVSQQSSATEGPLEMG
jgi:hypothetical protein